MSFLREETVKRGFKTVDGVHMGPCEIHKQHAHTIGPDGSLYACPGFGGNLGQSTGHIDDRQDDLRSAAATTLRKDHRVERLQRLRVHPRVRRWLLSGRAHRTRRHEQAELPQAKLRGWRRDAGAARRRGRWRTPRKCFNFETRHRFRDERSTNVNGKKATKKEGHAAPMAGGRFARPPAVRLLVFGKTQQISTV